MIKSFSLTLSLFFFLIAKHQIYYDIIGSNNYRIDFKLQIAAIFFLILSTFPFKKLNNDTFIIFFLAILHFLINLFILSYDNIYEFINFFFIILSFPISYFIASSFNLLRIIKFYFFILFLLLFLSFFFGDITTSYYGDFRKYRYIFGFLKPTFLSEAMLLLFFFVNTLSANQKKFFFIFINFLCITLIFLSGSRSGLACILLFLYLNFEKQLNINKKIIIKLFIRSFIIIFLIFYAFFEFNFDNLNLISSNRIEIIIADFRGNINTPLVFLFGNMNAENIFLSYQREGFLYHIDNFYAERFIVTGLFGCLTILYAVFSLHKNLQEKGKIYLYVILFYGLFENSIFNLTSFFSVFSIIITLSYLKR